jgi:3'-phosphoadenosine 5'-phosphosulfate (PAPS) 3'-phosphatase
MQKGLKDLHLSHPIISEENPSSHKLPEGGNFWTLDALDATHRFIDWLSKLERAEEPEEPERTSSPINGWGIHLAFIEKFIPKFGFIYLPARQEGTLYYTNESGEKAFRERNNETKELKLVEPEDKSIYRLASSPNHNDSLRLRNIQTESTLKDVGGLRLIRVAEADADIAHLDQNYNYWDTAASQAIFRALGGKILNTDTLEEYKFDNSELKSPKSIGVHPSLIQKIKTNP